MGTWWVAKGEHRRRKHAAGILRMQSFMFLPSNQGNAVRVLLALKTITSTK